MDEPAVWSNERDAKKRGKDTCKSELATSEDVNYQSTGWPDSYPNEMTPVLYKQFYGEPLDQPMDDIDRLNVFCMTWNTESVNICAYRDGKWYGRKSPPVYLKADKCYKSLELIERIKMIIKRNEEIDLMVFGFQESAKPGDYFFSWSLPEFLKKEGYVMLKRERAIGIGLTTFTKQKLRGLRLSLFIKRSIYENLAIRIVSTSFNPCGGEYTKELVRGKGGLQMTLDIEGFGKYMFINYHLPFSPHRLNPDNPKKGELLLFQTDCFTDTYKKFIKQNNPDYVFVMGDLNYRIQGLREDQMFDKNDKIRKDQFGKWYEDYDELHKLVDRMSQTDEPFEDWELLGTGERISEEGKDLREGIDNKGPEFSPTCKMMKGREPDCTDRMCYQVTHKDGNFRLPSWCDRILYSHRNLSKPHIVPVVYSRIDEGSMMTCSDHAGVYGIFTIGR